MNVRVTPPPVEIASDAGACAAPNPQETYDWLAGRPHDRPTDRFDIHALASVFALVLAETDWGARAPLGQALGLSFDEAVAIVVAHFPHALVEIAPALGHGRIERSEDEAALLELLWRSVIEPDEPSARLAKIVARRAQQPNPLWRDLGLRNRGELSTLMNRHFPELARRNARDFRWKVYLRRTMCQATDYTLCTALSCLECDDFFACFGEETADGLPVAREHGGWELLAEAV